MPRKKGKTNTGYSLEERPRASGKPHWRVRIWVDDPATGKRKLQVVGIFPTKTQAQREGAKAVEQRERGTLLEPNDTTVSELLDVWMTQELPKTVRPENRENYRIIIEKHIKPALGTIRVQKLTTPMIEAFYARLIEGGYSSSLVKKAHLRLRSALNLAVRWKWILANPADSATVTKISYKETDVWTPVETARFLDSAKDDHLTPYWNLATETGARTSELLGLGWEDLDPDGGTLTIGRRVVRLLKGTPILKIGPKTTSGRRTIRLTGELLDALKAHQKRHTAIQQGAEDWQDNGLIFPTSSGRPINPAAIRRSFNRIVKKAEVKPLSPHGLRRSHVTLLVESGANVKAIAARVGHHDVATTLGVYARLTAPMAEELHQVVERIYNRAPADPMESQTSEGKS